MNTIANGVEETLLATEKQPNSAQIVVELIIIYGQKNKK